MKVAAVIVVLMAAIGVVTLWAFSVPGGSISPGLLVGTALVVVLVVWIAEGRRRHRRRTRLSEMRGSALW